MTEPLTTEEPLRLFTHYSVEKVIGSGAMGLVYLATDSRLGRPVALKTLQARREELDDTSAEKEFHARFRREAELCGKLNHPNIVTLYEAGYEGDRVTFLAMEYVEGESALSLLRRHGRLPVETVLKIAEDVLQALTYAHERGVIHRDVKPANMLVNIDGRAKITDFGIARSKQSDLTLAGRLLGTPHYISPEQVIGKGTDARSDLYSLGVSMYEMFSGVKPFDGKDLADVLYKVVNKKPDPIRSFAPEVPEWCDAFVAQLMAKEPDARIQSARLAAEELRRLLVANGLADPTQVSMNVPIRRAFSAEDTPTTPLEISTIRDVILSARFDRPVPRGLSFTLIALMIVTLGIVVVEIDRRAVDTPTARFDTAQIQEFQQKRVTLREAKILYDAGAFEESIERYDAYLQKYPWSTVAKQGRERAMNAKIARDEAEKVTGIKVTRPRIARTTPAVTESPVVEQPVEAKPSTWERVKRWFRGGK